MAPHGYMCTLAAANTFHSHHSRTTPSPHAMQSSLYGSAKAVRASPTGPSRYEHMEEEIHRENEAMLQALGNSVSHMKAMAGHLNREAEEQNQLLQSLDKAFQTARGGVHTAVSSVKNVMGRYGWKHTALFGAVGFAVLYILYVVLFRSTKTA
jgi:blocked early in transport 1